MRHSSLVSLSAPAHAEAGANPPAADVLSSRPAAAGLDLLFASLGHQNRPNPGGIGAGSPADLTPGADGDGLGYLPSALAAADAAHMSHAADIWTSAQADFAGADHAAPLILEAVEKHLLFGL